MDASDAGSDSAVPAPAAQRIRASDQDRTTTVATLGDAYAEGRLDYAEFQERSEKAWQAVSTRERPGLVRALRPAAAEQPGASARAGHRRARAGGAPGPGISFAMMSGQERSGRWNCPAQHTVITTMGGVDLDLRQAVFESADTTITCICLMGGVSITVPDDVDIDVSGLGLMGGFGSSRKAREVVRPKDGVRVRINGVAIMGGVEITRKDEEG